MAAHDKKQHILEVVKSAGTLDGPGIKKRVCEREKIPLDDYKKPTFHRHLNELVLEGKLIAMDAGGQDDNDDEDDDDDDDDDKSNPAKYRKKTYKLAYDGNDIIGHAYLKQLGGTIFAPKSVQVFGIRILEGIVKSELSNDVCVVLEVSHNYFTLCISQNALPFNIHLSRNQHDPSKTDKIIKAHGGRTIVLEIKHERISSLKDDDPKRTGHLLMKFDAQGQLDIEDLGSSNGTASRELPKEEAQTMVKKANRNPYETSRETFIEKEKTVALVPYESKRVKLPHLLVCSDSLSIVVFKA